MSEVTHDCTRCASNRITFDVRGQALIGTNYDWQSIFEAFCVCRRCNRSTVLVLALRSYDHHKDVLDKGFWGQGHSLNRFFDVKGHITAKDNDASPPPADLPEDVESAYSEGAKCVVVDCNNAAAAMFRLALDLATTPLLPPVGEPDPPHKVRRDLGLRLKWMFENKRLPGDLQELSDCVREDGNDGAHRGNVGKDDAEDLQDFCFELLDRLYSEPARLAAAKERREARRAGAAKP